MAKHSPGLFVWSCALEFVGAVLFLPLVLLGAATDHILDSIWNIRLDWRTHVRNEADPRSKREKLRHLTREWPYLPGEILLTEAFGGGLKIARVLERFYWSGGYLLTEVPISRIAEGIAWNEDTNWKPMWKHGTEIDGRCLARLLLTELTSFEKRWVDEHAIKYDALQRRSTEELEELFRRPDALIGKSEAEIIRVAGRYQNAMDNDRGRSWLTWEYGQTQCTVEFTNGDCSEVIVAQRQSI